MADITTNFSASAVGTSQTVVFTSSTVNGAIVHSLFVANLLATDIIISIKAANTHLVKDMTIPGNNTLVLDKPVTLQNGQTVTVQSDTAASVDVFGSVVTRS
jgi:hypothetical protein